MRGVSPSSRLVIVTAFAFQFAVRGHKRGKIAMHQCCSGNTHYVMLQPEEMAKSLDVDLEKDLKVIPTKYKSVIFFNNCIPHRRYTLFGSFIHMPHGRWHRLKRERERD